MDGLRQTVPGELDGAPGHPGCCLDCDHPRCDPDCCWGWGREEVGKHEAETLAQARLLASPTESWGCLLGALSPSKTQRKCLFSKLVTGG